MDDAALGKAAAADYAIVIGFFVSMLAIGLYYAGRMRTLKDYFSGGRQVPWWLGGVSMYMSSFSAFAFVTYSELAYKYGLASVTLFWTTVPATALTAYFLASRWRRASSTSPLEYIETRYGPALRQGLSWLGAPMTIIDDGLKLYAIGTLVKVSLGWELRWVIVGSGLLMLAYTFLGGLWAVLVTDFVQFIVMVVAIIVLIPLSLARVGGLGGFVRQAPTGFFGLATNEYTPAYILAFFIIMVLSMGTRWSFVQRYYAVRNDSDARKVGYTVAVLNILGPPLMFLPAMAARQYLPDVANTREVYALLCQALLPVGMMGMMIAAMFSATMSMLSGDYNVVAAVLTSDVYHRWFARRASQRALVLAGRIATIVVGLIATGIGLYMAEASGKGDLFTVMANLFGVLLPPMAIPMVAGLLTKKTSNTGGISGFMLGSLAGIATYLIGGIEGLDFLRNIRYLTWITCGATLLGLGLGTWLKPNSPGEVERIGRFLDGLTRKARPEDEAPEDETGEPVYVSTLPVIGASTAALGALLIVVLLATAPLEEARISLIVGLAMVACGLAFWCAPLVMARNKRKGVIDD